MPCEESETLHFPSPPGSACSSRSFLAMLSLWFSWAPLLPLAFLPLPGPHHHEKCWCPICGHVLGPKWKQPVQSNAVGLWFPAVSWGWISLAPARPRERESDHSPRSCWDSLWSTVRWHVRNKWLLKGHGCWCQKTLFLLTLPSTHFYWTVFMRALIMSECPRGIVVHTLLL